MAFRGVFRKLSPQEQEQEQQEQLLPFVDLRFAAVKRALRIQWDQHCMQRISDIISLVIFFERLTISIYQPSP